MKQRALSFPSTTTFTRENYVVGACNSDAHRWLDAWPMWSGSIGALILGEPHSGKTHLSHTFLEKNPNTRILNGPTCIEHHPFDLTESLFVIDNADCVPASWLFHFFNHVKDNGTQFVMTMSQPYQEWCDLADLSSRLATLPLFTLNLPDDVLMLALLRKNLADRGVHVEENVLTYLVQHMDR